MAEQTSELFEQYKKTGDVKIRDKIVEKYLYIADILAKKFAGRGVEYDDLKQVASLSLLRGVERFDPDMGYQFTTFITTTITGEIKNYFRDKSRLVKLPRKLSEASAKIRSFVAEWEGRYGEKPKVKEIAEHLCLSDETVVRALEIGGTISLDSSVKEEGEQSLYAFLPDENAERIIEKLEVKDALQNATKDLSEIEKRFIKYRYTNRLSQSETAKKLGVSQMSISRLEKKLLLKLKSRLTGVV